MIFKYFYKSVICLLTGILPLYSYAAIQIEVKSNDITEVIWSDSNNIYIKSGEEPVYTLVNAGLRHLHKINGKENQITNLSNSVIKVPQIPDVQGISIEFVLHGAGPVLMGLDTELYLLKVNNEICRTEYLAKSDGDLTNILPGLDLLTEYKINTTFRDLPEDLDLCFVAEHLAYKRYSKYGFPIKSEDQFGKVQFELISINKNAANPPNDFKLPENYTVTSDDEITKSSNKNN